MSGFRLSPFAAKKRQDVDMTQGNILRHIISFALPLMIGNLFQQLYNMVDVWVLGEYASSDAFSAVGLITPVCNMLIGFFLGLSSGAGVVISQYYGAGQYDKVEKAVHTAVLMTLCLGVLFTIIGVSMTPTVVSFMNLAPERQKEAITYLSIYFSGIMGLMLYNIGSGILRAVGDSRRPFYFLVICAVLNTVLDITFAEILPMEYCVVGVATATIIAQSLSAILALTTLYLSKSCIQLRIRKLRFQWDLLKKIFTVGLPAALQMAITSFSNVFVQSYIEGIAPSSAGGWTIYSKVDQILMLPTQSISVAATTFVGQNLGKNQPERARKGINISLFAATIATCILMIPVILFAEQIARFFRGDDAGIVEYATLFLRVLTPFYVLFSLNQILVGALRGAGNSRTPMFISLGSFVLFRQVYLYIMSRIWNEAIPIGMAYPAGWFLCTLILFIYYKKVKLGKTRLVND